MSPLSLLRANRCFASSVVFYSEEEYTPSCEIAGMTRQMIGGEPGRYPVSDCRACGPCSVGSAQSHTQHQEKCAVCWIKLRHYSQHKRKGTTVKRKRIPVQTGIVSAACCRSNCVPNFSYKPCLPSTKNTIILQFATQTPIYKKYLNAADYPRYEYLFGVLTRLPFVGAVNSIALLLERTRFHSGNP